WARAGTTSPSQWRAARNRTESDNACARSRARSRRGSNPRSCARSSSARCCGATSAEGGGPARCWAGLTAGPSWWPRPFRGRCVREAARAAIELRAAAKRIGNRRDDRRRLHARLVPILERRRIAEARRQAELQASRVVAIIGEQDFGRLVFETGDDHRVIAVA